MNTYMATVLGCLTAMAIVAYGKELRERYRRRENLFFRRNRDDYWDHWQKSPIKSIGQSLNKVQYIEHMRAKTPSIWYYILDGKEWIRNGCSKKKGTKNN